MNYLNSGEGYALFKKECGKKTYVDKSLLIDTICQYAHDVNQYICVTRPRRFGKSTAANMIAAFFDSSRAEEAKILFDLLRLGTQRDQLQSDCWTAQGQKNVIRINMIDLITEKTTSYADFIHTLYQNLMEDLTAAYPAIHFTPDISLSDALKRTGDEFVFVIDEWDAIFEMHFMRPQDKEDYIQLLKALLKDKSYVYLAYMTGILPIAKYSSGSPLNMFDEFSAFQDEWW